jgi:hypothetical protein
MSRVTSAITPLRKLFGASNKKTATERELILHVGAPKTASTFLVQMLKAQDKNLFEKADLTVIFRRQMIDSGLSKALDKMRKSQDVSGLNDIAATIRKLAGRSRSKVLMTNENTLSSLRTPDFFDNAAFALGHIKEAWGGPIRIILYTRSQTDFIESAYLQEWHLGRSPVFSDFLDRCVPEKMSWLRVVEDLTSVVGEKNVHVRPYESIKRLGDREYFRDFLEMAGVENLQQFAIATPAKEGRVQNRSYSALALQIAGHAHPLITPDEQKHLRTFLQTHFSTASHPKAVLLSKEQRNHIIEMHRRENVALFDRMMPGFDVERDKYI